MKKFVTVTVLAKGPSAYKVRLSNWRSEKEPGKVVAPVVVSLSRDDFAKLAADHDMTPEDFRVNVPRAVCEPDKKNFLKRGEL